MITSSGATEARSGRSRLARAGLLTLTLVVAAGLGLLASACGGSSGEGVAQVGSTQSTTTESGSGSADPAAYSACMRKNGVPKFPDPDSEGHINISAGPGLDPNSPRYKAAERACKKYLPSGSEDKPSPAEQARGLREALRHAACMRAHGVPNYPDPKLNAEGGLDTSFEGTGINANSPQYKAAEQACKDLAPGANGGAQSQRTRPGATP
jgi:hypothetical protein